MSQKKFTVTDYTEDTLLIKFGEAINEETNSSIRNFCSEYERLQKPFGMGELVPTYCSVTVYFDPLIISCRKAKRVIQTILKTICETGKGDSTNTDCVVHEIPVCYEKEYSLDMDNVCECTHLSKEEIVKLHTKPEYTIYMLGFLPGFPYLGGLDKRLEVPRLKTPRKLIPEGSVALAGKQTGIYPLSSPGGWQIIGRTPIKLFDAARTPNVLIKAGDKIKFTPISKKEYENYKEEKRITQKEIVVRKRGVPISSGIQFLSSGFLTTVQDLGRKGFLKDGVGESGAMDIELFKEANALVGNNENAAALEITLLGPVIKFSLKTSFVITGNFTSAKLDSSLIEPYKKYEAQSGDVLDVGYCESGSLRGYIAFFGGIVVKQIMGSSSTNTKSNLGGKKLEANDELAIGWNPSKVEDIYGKRKIRRKESITKIRVVKGPQYKMFVKEAVKDFQKNTFEVSKDCDRMGCRLIGVALPIQNGTDIISDCVTKGAVQITSEGLPIIMMADRQTTGGYAKIANVIKADLWKVAQAVPNEKIQFQFVSNRFALSQFKKNIRRKYDKL